MRILDLARGAYVRSPSWVRDLAGPLLAAAPASLRYGRAYRTARNEIAAAQSDPVLSTRMVRARLAALAETAAASPYWRSRLAPFAASPFDENTLRRLSILTKPDIRDNAAAMCARPCDTLDAASTSGSAGEPLVFFLDKDRSVREIAFVNSIWARAGYTEDDARCVFRGLQVRDLEGAAIEWEAGLKELRISPFRLTRERLCALAEEIRRRGIRYLHGYPSAIEIFAREATRGGLGALRIEGVFPISEPLYPHQRALIEAAFPTAVIAPFYGLSERVLFAGEVAQTPGRYVFEPLYGFAELVDESGAAVETPGRQGRILGTGFLSKGMPLFRYDTGDLAVLVEAATPENGFRLKVEAITPRRKPEFLIGAEGQRFVAPTIVPLSAAAFAAVDQFQFRQTVPGEAEVKVIPRAGADEAALRPFLEELQGRLGSALALRLVIVEALPHGGRGKRALVDQMLAVD